MDIKKALNSAKLLPIITLKNDEAIQNVKILIDKSDIEMVEVAFRSDLAVKAIKEYSTIENVIIGAGTVRTVAEARQAVEAGARFLVSPGYDTEVVNFAIDNNIPITPGILTPSEIQTGISEAGLSIFKLFPAKLVGGLSAVKALSGPFYDIQFLPTGGVNEENFEEFLSNDYIIAVGGSFIMNDQVKKNEIDEEIKRINTMIEKAKNIN